MIRPLVTLRGFSRPVPVTHSAVPRRKAARALRALVGTRANAAERAARYDALAARLQMKWGALLDKAHLERFGAPWEFWDYRVSGIGRAEYSEQWKPALRALARGAGEARALAGLWRYVAQNFGRFRAPRGQ